MEILKKRKYTIILFLALFVLSAILRGKTARPELIKDILFAGIGTSIIYVLLDLFVAIKLRWLAVVFLAILFTADTTLFYIYQKPMNYGIVASIFETNLDEVMSMAQGLWIVVLLLFVLSVFLLTKSTGEMKQTKRIPILFSVLYLFTTTFVLPPVSEMITFKMSTRMVYEEMTMSPHMYFGALIPAKYPFIIGDFIFFIVYREELRVFEEYANYDKKLPQGVAYDKGLEEPTKFVLIVGESAQRKHMSVYGYDVATTPFLDNLKNNSDELHIFDSVISPASFTRDAIRMTLSFATPINKAPFWENMNVMDLANNAGYETIWIGNQAQFGLQDIYASRVSVSADKRLYNKEAHKKGYRIEDLNLVPVFRENLKKNEKQFIILHLTGSHMYYNNKYDEIDTKALGSKGATNEYDKSIHHTDRVIAQLYDVVKDQGDTFTILYYSDHAEVVNLGHGMSDRYKDQFTIPLVVISDMPDRSNYFELISKYYNESTKRLSSTSLIYFLSEMIGYSVSKEHVEKAKNETELIYQTDGSIKRYSEIRD